MPVKRYRGGFNYFCWSHTIKCRINLSQFDLYLNYLSQNRICSQFVIIVIFFWRTKSTRTKVHLQIQTWKKLLWNYQKKRSLFNIYISSVALYVFLDWRHPRSTFRKTSVSFLPIGGGYADYNWSRIEFNSIPLPWKQSRQPRQHRLVEQTLLCNPVA